MGLAFYLADNRRAINLETRYANLSGELYEYLYQHSEELPPEVAFFYRLDPYGEESFDSDQAGYIAGLCERLLAAETDALSASLAAPEISKTSEPTDRDDEYGEPCELSALPPFLRSLRELCVAARESRSHIIMLGD